MDELNNEQLLDVIGSKGPVCLCAPARGCHGGNIENRTFCGPQRRVHRAWAILRSRGAPRPHAGLVVAADHAHAGEGRGEYDAEFGRYRAALGAS